VGTIYCSANSRPFELHSSLCGVCVLAARVAQMEERCARAETSGLCALGSYGLGIELGSRGVAAGRLGSVCVLCVYLSVRRGLSAPVQMYNLIYTVLDSVSERSLAATAYGLAVESALSGLSLQ